jgi:hypothetical protein
MPRRDWSTATVARSADQVSCDLRGETAILRLSSGVYYGLDPIGTRVWTLLAEPTQLADLVDCLVADYEVDRPRCEHDVVALLDDLDAHGLLTISPR